MKWGSRPSDFPMWYLSFYSCINIMNLSISLYHSAFKHVFLCDPISQSCFSNVIWQYQHSCHSHQTCHEINMCSNFRQVSHIHGREICQFKDPNSKCQHARYHLYENVVLLLFCLFPFLSFYIDPGGGGGGGVLPYVYMHIGYVPRKRPPFSAMNFRSGAYHFHKFPQNS